MTLEEAIEHSIEKSKDPHCSKECRMDHKQLSIWLKELKTFKAKQPIKQYSWNDTHPDYDAILKSEKVKNGNFSVAYQYVDDNGVKHWKTGWYSNRSNYIDDFRNAFHGE